MKQKKYILKAFFIILFAFFSTQNIFSQNYYWETPKSISPGNTNCRFPEALYASKNNSQSAIFFEEIDDKNNQLYISAIFGLEEKKQIAGPYDYSERIPKIYSAAQNSKGNIVLTVISEPTKIEVFTSNDNFKTFTNTAFERNDAPFIAPRVFCLHDGSFIIFTSLSSNEMYSLWYSKSSDGKTWSKFKLFAEEQKVPNTMNPLVPYVLALDNSDVLFYQAQYSKDNLISIQIYASSTTDGGNTWQSVKSITENPDFFPDYHNYNSQGIRALYDNGKIHIVWTRSPFNISNSLIYFATLSKDLSFQSKPEAISSISHSVSPRIFIHNNLLHVLWFTDQLGNNNTFLATLRGLLWEETQITKGSQSTFPAEFFTYSQNKKEAELSILWEAQDLTSSVKKGTNSILLLEKDSSTMPPVIKSINFSEKGVSNQDSPQISLAATSDSSDVKGFSWSFSQNPKDEPPLEIMALTSQDRATFKANNDGTWYIKVKQCDFAGNWSESAVISYNVDITPPKEVKLEELDLDEFGFTLSNTFNIKWTPPKESDIKGYTFTLKYIDSVPQNLYASRTPLLRENKSSIEKEINDLIEKNKDELNKDAPLSPFAITEKPEASFSNIRNGLYIFTVAAIDNVGNIGKTYTTEILLNKYNPTTAITKIDSKILDTEETELEIFGLDFTYGGTVQEVYIDKDGKAPYDRTLLLSKNDFTVKNNFHIANIKLSNLQEGEYKIGLLHSQRGIFFTEENVLKVEESGTIKEKALESYNTIWNPVTKRSLVKINISDINAILIIILSILLIFTATQGIVSGGRETVNIHKEIDALVAGEPMPHENKKQINALERKKKSLRTRLMFYSTIPVILIEIVIILTFGLISINIQEKTLTEALGSRTNIILDAITKSVQNYLPSQDTIALSDAAAQVFSLQEAELITICGENVSNGTTAIDYVWATTDDRILERLDTNSFIPGTSRLQNPNVQEVFTLAETINLQARNQLGLIRQTLSELEKENRSLLGKTDEASLERLQEIQEIHSQLTKRSSDILNSIADKNSGTIPNFHTASSSKGNESFIFYKPIIYQQSFSETFIHGFVFIKINTNILLKQINDIRKQIFRLGSIIIVVSIIVCIIFALIISTLIVRPLKKLVNYVEFIRDTEDKEKLEGKTISIRRTDEIGILGDTLNEMSNTLAAAAKTTKTLTLGKDIQTKFIPLRTDEKENILSSGKYNAEGAEFYTYYAGADDLSGDYVDYKRIGPHHYAIIKCDISGHGAPAALIMVEVATLFLSTFNNWDVKNPRQGTNLVPVVDLMNDLLESRGFKGRFAAFTLCILDTLSGECTFCNAGDNLVQIYDRTLQKKRTIQLKETPAAGMFTTEDINRKGGYPVSKLTLRQGDVLFLYTDGIEESKRFFRNERAQIIECEEPGLSTGEVHENHLVGEKSEQFTPERVTEIIEHVMTKKTYTLTRHHDSSNTTFIFDFSTCQGKAEDAILALASIEKVFRFYRAETPKLTDRVKIDKELDEFLRIHFMQYSIWCSSRKETKEDPTHVYYQGILEDKQFDDLTLFAIKKN